MTRHRCIALNGVGRHVALGIDSRRAAFLADARHFGSRMARPHDQPAADRAQIRIQRAQTVHQKGDAFVAGIG